MTERRDAAFLKSILQSSSAISIICTDLDGNILTWNIGAENIFGYAESEVVGKERIGLLYADEESKRIMHKAKAELLDSGQTITREIQEQTRGGYERWIKMTLSPRLDNSGQIIGILGIGEDVTLRKNAEERLQQSLRATIGTLVRAVETKDPYTAGHQHRVADLAVAIAQKMNTLGHVSLDADRIAGIHMAAQIHDLGKLAIPSEILCKPTRLSPTEFELIKVHSQAGHDIVKDVNFPWPIADIILQHHEKRDGSGYPQALTLIDICLDAQILTVADVVEAMASHRPYRPALPLGQALEHIEKQMDFLYYQPAVLACLALFREDGYSSKW